MIHDGDLVERYAGRHGTGVLLTIHCPRCDDELSDDRLYEAEIEADPDRLIDVVHNAR